MNATEKSQTFINFLISNRKRKNKIQWEFCLSMWIYKWHHSIEIDLAWLLLVNWTISLNLPLPIPFELASWLKSWNENWGKIDEETAASHLNTHSIYLVKATTDNELVRISFPSPGIKLYDGWVVDYASEDWGDSIKWNWWTYFDSWVTFQWHWGKLLGHTSETNQRRMEMNQR